MFCSNEVQNVLVADNACLVIYTARQKVTIAGFEQKHTYLFNADLEGAGDNPVRLVLGMEMRCILGTRRVTPLMNVVTFDG